MTEREEALDPNTSAARLRHLAEKNLGLAKKVAKNPAAPPELLHQFASAYNQDPGLLALVIANPNTPKETLIIYGWSQPKALLQNPFFEILLLEDPLLLQSIPERTLAALLSQPNTPLPLLEQSISHKDPVIQSKAFSALLARVEVSVEFLERHARSENTSFQCAIAGHPKTPLSLLKELLREESSQWPVLACLATNPQTTPEMLLVLSANKHETVLLAVAQNSKSPTTALTSVASCNNLNVLRDVAAHPNTDITTLEHLSYQEDETLLQYISARASLSQETLWRLAGHPSLVIHRGILQNKDALEQRRLFYRAGYREIASFAPSDEALDELPSPDPSLSQEELMTLSGGLGYARQLAAAHPSASTELLTKLSLDSAVMVRRTVTRNPNTTAELLLSMKRDKEESLRISLMYHPNCSMGLFYALSADHSLDVRLALALYEKVPHKILKNLFEENSDPKGHIKKAIARNAGIDPAWLLALAKYHDIGLRQSVAKNMSATPEILQLLASDESDRVRLVVAQHPKISEELLATLSEDDAAGVSAEAKKNVARRAKKDP